MEFRQIELENTKFIFNTNFAGDPNNDPRFHSTARQGNIIIPDPNLAHELMDEGFNVKETRPRPGYEEEFEPQYFIAVKLSYNGRRPPKVYLVSGDAVPVLLDEDSVCEIDRLQENRSVANVNCLCNVYHNEDRDTKSLYINVMYVEQLIDDDPYAARYARHDDPEVQPPFDPDDNF